MRGKAAAWTRQKSGSATNDGGIDAYFPILRGVVSLQEAMEQDNARSNMTAAVEQVFRLVKCLHRA